MKKRLLFALGAALLFAITVQAQKSVEDVVKAQTDRMKLLLQLKDDQAKKLYDINLRYAQMAKDARDEGMKQRDAAKTQMDDKKREIEAVLKPSQKAAMEAFFATIHGQKPEGGGGAPPAGARSFGKPEGGRPNFGPDSGPGQSRMAPQRPQPGRGGFEMRREGGFGMRRGGSSEMSGEMSAKMHSEQMQGLLQLSDDQTEKIYDIELKYFNMAKADREAAMKQIKENMLKLRDKHGEVEAILTPAQKIAFAQISKMEREKFSNRMRR